MHKTPPGLLGLVGPRPDERTLPLSERLERYRDTEASAMALATSGNGLELVHSKAVPRWCWLVFWTTAAVAVSIFLPALAGLADFARAYTILFGAAALLPLASTTGRAFVQHCQWGGPFYFFVMWFGFAFQGFAAGRWATAGFWGPLFCFDVFLLLFRKRLFLCGVFITLLLGLAVNPPITCVYFDSLRAVQFATYSECVATKYCRRLPVR